LEEVSSGRGAQAGQQCAGALVGDDLTEAADEALIVGDGVELYSCFDTVIARAN